MNNKKLCNNLNEFQESLSYIPIVKAKDFENGNWVHGYLCCFDKRYYIIPLTTKNVEFVKSVKVIRETICYSTGKYDCDGNLIFTNDVLDSSWCFVYHPGIVRFGDYHTQESAAQSKDYNCGHTGFFVEHLLDEHGSVRNDIRFFENKSKVVGNIIDNPELIDADFNPNNKEKKSED